jgi:hypothetical protein
MKKYFFIFLLLSCQKKSVPVITERKADLPRKTESVYPPKATIAADTLLGSRLFIASCGRCHGLPEPKQFSKEKWEAILPLMFPRSRFNNEEALHVRAYVLANALN